jgi:hypothetical protein
MTIRREDLEDTAAGVTGARCRPAQISSPVAAKDFAPANQSHGVSNATGRQLTGGTTQQLQLQLPAELRAPLLKVLKAEHDDVDPSPSDSTATSASAFKRQARCEIVAVAGPLTDKYAILLRRRVTS